VSQKQASAQGTKVELQRLWGDADFVSLHTPLTAATRNMIDDAALALMKPTAYLINCARGAVVDTEALVRALDSSAIAGCALDTTNPEPLPDLHPLRGRDNVILTPHVAWYSEQAMKGLQAGAPAEVRRVLSGEWPINVVNPDVRKLNRAGIE